MLLNFSPMNIITLCVMIFTLPQNLREDSLHVGFKLW